MQPDGSIHPRLLGARICLQDERTFQNGVLVRHRFRVVNASWQSSVQQNIWFFCVKTFRGCVMTAKCFMNLQ